MATIVQPDINTDCKGYKIQPYIREEIIRDIEQIILLSNNDKKKSALYITKLCYSYDVYEYILDFFEDLLKYTDATFENIIEILNGAFVVLKTDGSYFYHKYKPFNYVMSGIDAERKPTAAEGFLYGTSHKSLSKQARIGRGSIESTTSDHQSLTGRTSSEQFDLLLGQISNREIYNWSSEPDSSQGNSTWFQFEYARGSLPTSINPIARYTTKPTLHSTGHWIGTIKYAIQSKLVGPRNQGPLGTSTHTESNPLIINTCARMKKKDIKYPRKRITCPHYNKTLEYKEIINEYLEYMYPERNIVGGKTLFLARATEKLYREISGPKSDLVQLLKGDLRKYYDEEDEEEPF